MALEDDTPLVYPLGHEQPPRLARRMAWRSLTGETPAPAAPVEEPEGKSWWSWHDAGSEDAWNVPAPQAPGMKRRRKSGS